MRPDSTIALPRSMRFTVPVSRLSSRSRKSFSTCSRSASRIFCRMTCFAACAPMRPTALASIASSTMSPSCRFSPRSGASVIAIWRDGSSCSSSGTTVQRRNAEYSPLSRSIAMRTSTSLGNCFFVAEASAISSAWNTVSFGTFFSRERASTSSSTSFPLFIVLFSIRSSARAARARSLRAARALSRRRSPAAHRRRRARPGRR